MTDLLEVKRTSVQLSSVEGQSMELLIPVGDVRVTPSNGGVEQTMADALGGNHKVTPTTAPFVINGNASTAALPTFLSGTLLALLGKDSQNSGISVLTYGGSTFLRGKRANGTRDTPSAIKDTNNILTLSGFGYGATDYAAVAGVSITLSAAQDWTDTKQGTRINFNTTKNDSATGAEVFSIENDGATVFTSLVPASAAAAGKAGTITWGNGFVYVCVATDTWQRAAIATW